MREEEYNTVKIKGKSLRGRQNTKGELVERQVIDDHEILRNLKITYLLELTYHTFSSKILP